MLCYLGLCRDQRNLKSPAHCERAGSSPAPGDQKLLNKNNTFTVGIVTVTAKIDLARYDSLLTLNNLADHRYRLSFIHRGCANDVVHHPGKRCSYR